MALDLLQRVRNESDRFAAVLDDCEPTAAVPTCPGWTADDLLWHLAEVQYFWAWIVQDAVRDPDSLAEPARPQGWSATADFFRTANAALVAALESAPDDAEVWTWAADKSAGFVRRRQAHEALIHRIDAEVTAGIESRIDADFAADGVLEVLQWMFAVVPWAERTTGGPVGRVTATDTGDSWLLQVGRWSGTSPNSARVYTDEASLSIVDHGSAEFEIAALAADLDLWLWNRPTTGEVSLTGNTVEFERIITEGVQ